MRTTIHIEDGLFADLMRLTHATTKTQAVREALKEFIRLRCKEELLALQGRLEIEDNWRQLRESELEEA
jgi:Arc/MetJ family transcription regulator